MIFALSAAARALPTGHERRIHYDYLDAATGRIVTFVEASVIGWSADGRTLRARWSPSDDPLHGPMDVWVNTANGRVIASVSSTRLVAISPHGDWVLEEGSVSGATAVSLVSLRDGRSYALPVIVPIATWTPSGLIAISRQAWITDWIIDAVGFAWSFGSSRRETEPRGASAVEL